MEVDEETLTVEGITALTGEQEQQQQQQQTQKTQTQASPMFSTQDYMLRAHTAADSLNFGLAVQFAKRALAADPDNVMALEMLGTFHVQLGNTSEAVDCFTRCVQLSPNVGYSKYMYMGQLHTGLDAVKWFKKGIERMAASENNGEDEEAIEGEYNLPLSRKIANGLCSIAEIYLTDSCFEDDAETSCEQALAEALRRDPQSSEVHRLLASLRLSQCRPDDALNELDISYNLWAHLDPSDPSFPDFSSRLSTAKLLLECNVGEQARDVVDSLLEEDDEVVEIWYLDAVVKSLMGKNKSAMASLKHARELFAKVQSDDEELMEKIMGMIQNLEILKPLEDAPDEDEMDEMDEDV